MIILAFRWATNSPARFYTIIRCHGLEEALRVCQFLCPCQSAMFDVTEQVGLGWGGVGMFTFLEHAHMSFTSMFNVTEQVGLGWGGVGMFTFLEHGHMSLTSMSDVTEQVGLGWGGVGMFTFLEHAHMSLTSMFDVTEQVGLGWAGWECSRSWIMHT